MQKMSLDPYLSSYTKLKSTQIDDLNIISDTLKLLEEKVGSVLQYIGTGRDFLDRTLVTQKIRLGMDK